MTNSTTRDLGRDATQRPKSFSFFILLLLSAIVLAGLIKPSVAQDADPTINPIVEVTHRLENGKLYVASFEHTLVDSFTQDTTVQTGKIWVGKDAYKVKTNAQILVVDGKVSRAYDRYKNRLIISKYDPQDDDFAPSKILNGMDSTYSVKQNKVENNRRVVQLETEDPFATFTYVEVVTNLDYQPIAITAVDQTENEYVTRFYQGRFINTEPSLFELQVPEGTETVDLRKQ